MGHLFISYSKKDIAFARHLRQRLEAQGFAVSIDEQILDPGERWWREIEKSITAADAVIVVMSPNSAASDWVERELLYAERLRKPIFPVLLAGESWSRLANIQYADMTQDLEAEIPAFLTDALKRTVTPGDSPLPIRTTIPMPDRAPDNSRRLRLIATSAVLGTALFIALLLIAPSLNRPPALPTLTPTPVPTITPEGTPATPTPPPALPNLIVGRLRTSQRTLAPGQVFFLSISITNTGAAPSGAFSWTWDASLTEPVLLNSLSGTIDNIPPNGSKNISFPFSYGWWGSYNTQLVVDADSEIIESDERDNRRPFAVEISNLPFEIDFSVLPPDQLVEPPFTLVDESFNRWNLAFSLVSAPGGECPNARLTLQDLAGDIVLQINDDDPRCMSSGIRVDILRTNIDVTSISVDLIPRADGTARLLTYDARATNALPLAPPQTISVTTGEIVTLTSSAELTSPIRRFEVYADNGALRIAGMSLFRATS